MEQVGTLGVEGRPQLEGRGELPSRLLQAGHRFGLRPSFGSVDALRDPGLADPAAQSPVSGWWFYS